MALCLDYFEDEIFENQRRLQVVPAGIAPLDTQYKKIHLNSATDPSGWVDNEWKTVSPATKQPKEGHVYLEPWVYVINPPYTDEAGWIYKKQFSSPEEFPSNGVLTMVRTRKWKRKSVPVEQKAAALDIAERGQEESNRYNAFNLAFINKLFNAGTAAAEKFEYSLQIVCENRRLSSSMLSHDNRMEVFEDKVDTKKLMDPPIWTLYDIPKYMPHKYRKPHSTLNETTMRYVIATTSSLRIPFEGDVNATIAKLNTNSPAWDGAETPRSLSPDNAAPQSQQSMSYLNRPRRASLHKKLTSHATTPPLEVETKDWVALCGWNFFIDFATDDAGWEYSDSFYAKDSEGNTINQVNTDQWDRRYNNLLNCTSPHQVKRRYWCRVLVRQPQLLRARLHWRQFIAENKRGLIKRDTLYKQGHLRPNWLKRIFELHDYTFVYKTEGNSTRGSVDIVDKQLAFSNLGALLEENAGWNYGFKLVPEFSYSDYYPRFYEHEEDYEYFENLHNLMLLKRLQQVTGLKSSENKSKASGAKAGDRRSRSLSDASAASLLHIQTGAEPLDLGNHQSHVEGPRLTQSTLGSRAQAQTQVVSTRLGGAGMPVGRSFERPTDVSLNSERPKLTKTASGGGSVFGGSRFGGSMFGGSVFGSGAVFGGPDEHTARRKSISSRTLSSNKLILNSDKRRMHRPYLNMDATSRRQRDEWMDVLRHQIWLVNNANLAVTSTGVGRGTSNMVSESSAMYMVYDVEGSPPTVSGNFKDEKDNALFSYTTTTIDMLVPPPYRMTPNKLVKLPPLYTQFKPPPDPFPNGDVVYVPRSPSPETDHEALLEHQRKHEEYHHQHPHHKLARHSDEVDSEGKEAVSADTGAETASRSWKAFGLIRRVSAVFKSKPESPTLQTEKDSDYGDQADFDAVGSNIDNLTPSADPPPEREPTPEPISTYELPSLLEHGMTMKKRMIHESSFKSRFLWVGHCKQDGLYKLYWAKSESQLTIVKSVNICDIISCVRVTRVARRGLVASFSRRNIEAFHSEHENSYTNIFDDVTPVDGKHLPVHSHAPNPNAKSTSNNVKEEREFELLFCRGAVVSTNTATLGGDYEVLTSKSNKNKYKAPLTGIVLKTKTGECSVEWVDAINELMQYLDKDKPPGSEQALTSEKEDFLVI